MIESTTIALRLILIGIGLVCSQFMHERMHWVAGVIAGSDPEIKRSRYRVPHRVKHHSIQQTDDRHVLAIGIGNFFWLPLGIGTLVLFLFTRNPTALFVTSAILGNIFLVSTESDVTAYRDPDVFRERHINDEFDGTPLFYSDSQLSLGFVSVITIIVVLFLAIY